MIRNKDFALPYTGRAVFNRNGEYAGRNDMHGGMKPVSMGNGLENVSSKIWEEKVWGDKVWRH